MFEDIKAHDPEHKYIPVEALAKWNSTPPEKQAGILSRAAMRMDEDRRNAAHAARYDAQYGQQYQPQAFTMRNPVTGEDAPFVTTSNRSSAPFPQTGKNADTLAKLNTDVEQLSGAKLNKWLTSPERWEQDGFVYAGAAGDREAGGGVKMPSNQFAKMLDRYKRLEGAGPAAAAPAQQQQYPPGTRARRGDKWFVMTAQGWQPES